MKQSFIIVTEITEDLLLDGLMDFANLYSKERFADTIELFKEKGTQKFLVLFSNAPSFDHFCFAVNYIRYIQTPNKKLASVFGYYLNESYSYSFLNQGFVKTYVSANDKAFDNVNVVNQNNETYLFGFDMKIQKQSIIEEHFEVPHININDFEHVLDIVQTPLEVKPWWKFW